MSYVVLYFVIGFLVCACMTTGDVRSGLKKGIFPAMLAYMFLWPVVAVAEMIVYAVDGDK